MYTSREEARSDLFLSVAMYLIGPLFVGLLVSLLQLDRIPGAIVVLRLALPLVYTVLVPVLLIRYRQESLRSYGLLDGPDPTVPLGVLAALPLVAASLLIALLIRGDAAEALPMFTASSPVVTTLARVLEWTGTLLLALYVTVKARDAFGGIPVSLPEAVRRVGRVIVIATAVATVLLAAIILVQVGLLRAVAALLPPLGVLGGAALVWWRLDPRGSTTLPVLVAPALVLALRPLVIRFDIVAIVNSVYTAGMFAGIGLVVAFTVERTRRGLAVVTLGLMIAALTRLGPGGFGS